MLVMRIRAAGLVALWIIVAVLTSAVATCVPGVATSAKAPMSSCMGDGQLCVSPAGPTNCCVQVAPQLAVAKVGVKSPARVVMHWLAPIGASAAASALISIFNSGSPPDSTPTLGLPIYIIFGTILV